MPTTPTETNLTASWFSMLYLLSAENGSISQVIVRSDQELSLTRLSSLIVQSSKKAAEFEHRRPLP